MEPIEVRASMASINVEGTDAEDSGSSGDQGSAGSTEPSPNQSPIVVQRARAVKASSVNAFTFSSPADVFMSDPGDSFRAGDSGRKEEQLPVQLPMYLQALAQAQLWITCAGGIMVAFALNRARAVLAHYANQQHSQVKEGSFVSWRIDPDMVRSSAFNTAS